VHPLIPWFDPPVLPIPLPGGTALPLHGFGLLVALGFYLGSRVSMDRARRIGLDPEHINRLVGWLVVGTFIGGHVGYGLMYKPAEYFANPILFLRVWEGLSSMGGFLVCVPLAFYYFRKHQLPVWPYLDCLAHGLTLGWFFGRMGCFVAHDHPGPVTDFWLGVYGICPPGHNRSPELACHDMGLYEALWSFLMFLVFRSLDRRARVPGFYPLALGLAYGPTRFLMDFLRPESTDGRYFYLTPAQWVNIGFFTLCLWAIQKRRRSGDAPVWSPPGGPAPAV
jgi:phosphatidylglycerol:prolipoprotein diacylglycerol transferase